MSRTELLLPTKDNKNAISRRRFLRTSAVSVGAATGAVTAAILAKDYFKQVQEAKVLYDIQNPPDGTKLKKDPDTGDYIISINPVPPILISLAKASDNYGNILPIPARSQPVGNDFERAPILSPVKNIYAIRVLGEEYPSIKEFGDIRPIDPKHPNIVLAKRGLWFQLTNELGNPITKNGQLVDLNNKNSEPVYVAANFVIVEPVSPQKPQ